MSLIKELEESHDSIKALALNLLLIPFWYVAIFIFNNEFYVSSDIIIKLAMCIVISISSSVLFTIFLYKIDAEKKVNKTFFQNMIISVSMLAMWLSALIFATYSLGFLFNIYIYFYSFLVIYFSPIIFLNLLPILLGEKNTQTKK